MTQAASQLSLILSTRTSIDVSTAQTSCSFISSLIEQEVSLDSTVQPESSVHILSAVTQLARAVTSASDGEVRLQTASLNLTTEARAIEELVTRPVTADTLGGTPRKRRSSSRLTS